MSQIIRVYRQKMPRARFIGRIYHDSDRGADGGFGAQWEMWHAQGLFDRLSALPAPDFEDGDDSVGLMRYKEGEPFEYWIGMFRAADAPVPEGFSSADFDACELGVAWVRGTMEDVFMQEEKCAAACADEDFKIVPDGQGAYWFFERYACPRFTVPDENGQIVLDICHFIDGI